MLTLKENIRAVLDCCFPDCKDSLKITATNRIHTLFINKINKIEIVVNEVKEDKGDTNDNI